jgi:hypothetical protein
MTEAHRSKTPEGGGTPVQHSTRAAPQVRQPYAAARAAEHSWKLNLKNCTLFWSFTHSTPRGASIRYVARFGLRVLFHFVQRPRQK